MIWVWGAACGVDAAQPHELATQLSATGLYDDISNKQIASDALPLFPAFPLWSDGAVKRRWLILPPGTELDTTVLDRWQLPVGGKLFKEFVVDGRRIETRMIERLGSGDDDYRFAPFVWRADERDAVLAEDGAINVRDTRYDVPAVSDCKTCHLQPGRLLGVSAIQLSAQLAELPLSNPPNRELVISEPALGVLHGNCGHCHNPDGSAPMQTLQLTTKDATISIEETAPYRTTVGKPLEHWTGQGFDVRIAPGDPERSAIYYRLSQRGTPAQMPPLGTTEPNIAGQAVVRAWIERL